MSHLYPFFRYIQAKIFRVIADRSIFSAKDLRQNFDWENDHFGGKFYIFGDTTAFRLTELVYVN